MKFDNPIEETIQFAQKGSKFQQKNVFLEWKFQKKINDTATKSNFVAYPRFVCMKFDNPIGEEIQFGQKDQNFK